MKRVPWCPHKPRIRVYSFSSVDAARNGYGTTMPHTRIKTTRTARISCTASLDPWKTLGVPHDADEAAIKKAYRKLALQNHPDLKGSQAATRFVKIQEAYEVVTGKRRGSTMEEPEQPAKAGSWEFHDWYWKFTASKRWDQQKHKKPSSAPQPPRPTGAPESALQEQLAGLKRKAAYRRVTRRSATEPVQDTHHNAAGAPTSPYTQQGAAAGSPAAEQDQAHQGYASSSHHSPSVMHVASSQIAGLKRRAAMRMQTQHVEESSATPAQEHARVSAQDSSNNASTVAQPSHPIPASKEVRVGDLHAEHAAAPRHKHAAAASKGSAACKEDPFQEANGAVPWRRQHSAARSTFVSASALRVSVVGHPLAELNIAKCVREITSHLSWR